MVWINKYIKVALMATLIVIVSACSVSYKFNGASIDYSKTKTIQIAELLEKYGNEQLKPYVLFSDDKCVGYFDLHYDELKDKFNSHTRLEQVKRNGDLKIEGEITRYEQRNKSVSSEGYSAMTELSMTVNVRFTNNVKHSEDFEQQFTAMQSYESTQSLNSVQEELVGLMIKDICDQIFNATVANW